MSLYPNSLRLAVPMSLQFFFRRSMCSGTSGQPSHLPLDARPLCPYPPHRQWLREILPLQGLLSLFPRTKRFRPMCCFQKIPKPLVLKVSQRYRMASQSRKSGLPWCCASVFSKPVQPCLCPNHTFSFSFNLSCFIAKE